MILGHLRASDNTLPIWFVAGGNLTLTFLHTLTRFRVAVAFTSAASRREAMLRAWPTLLSICERSRCCSESASRLCVRLTHSFEGGVFVESHCAVVAVWVWKPLSKWPIG